MGLYKHSHSVTECYWFNQVSISENIQIYQQNKNKVNSDSDLLYLHSIVSQMALHI